MAPTRDDWQRVQRLREQFLGDRAATQALADYWRDDRDLAAYDAVLGARIGWKWDAALRELLARGGSRADGLRVLDYGCGSGVAARAFVRHCGAGEVLCHDRSAKAMAFAARRLQREFPALPARACRDVGAAAFDVVLVSHVLGELDAAGAAALRTVLRRARRIVLVEPGSKEVSRRLSALRDELRAEFTIEAPCPHAERCPALASDGDWCHFFAPPPSEVFTDGAWVTTARELGIDLRSLPYSFLAATRDRVAPTAALPANRMLGRPDIGKHAATVQLCTASTLREVRIDKRRQPELWRTLKKRPETLRELPL
jgi:SAM-dependent methyltransferase